MVDLVGFDVDIMKKLVVKFTILMPSSGQTTFWDKTKLSVLMSLSDLYTPTKFH